MSRPSLRETIAAGRSRMAQQQAKSKTIRGGTSEESWAFQSSGIPGVSSRRSNNSSLSFDNDLAVDSFGQPQKSIKSLIANAKGTGIMNLSNRGLTRVPMDVWKMYYVDPDKIVVDFNDTSNAWYNAVDLTRLLANDNQIDLIEDNIQEFGALTHIDFRNNALTSLPSVMDQLGRLAVLNLTSNKFETVPEVIFSLSTLLELHLSGNQIKGALSPSIAKLTKLETLDLSDNQLEEIPEELGELKSLRKLAISKNKLARLPASIVGKLTKLLELEVAENKLQFVLCDMTEGSPVTLPSLVRLDAKKNAIQRVTDIANTAEDHSSFLVLPAVKEIHLSTNALQDLENLLYSTKQLSTLDLRYNRFTHIPRGVLDLDTLRRLDMANNHMDNIPSALGNMVDLMTFVWEGNPVRNVPRSVTTTEGLMKLLRQRLDAEGDTQDPYQISTLAISENASAPTQPVSSAAPTDRPLHHDRPSTPPQSSVASSAEPVPARSPRGAGGNVVNLNLAKKALADVTDEDIGKNCSEPSKAILDYNALTVFPVALHSACSTTLTSISINHNKLKEFPWEQLAFPFLTSLDLSNNLLTALFTAQTGASSAEIIAANYPKLNELDITANRLKELPEWLPKAFPQLRQLRAARNKIEVIHPAGMEGLETIDLSGNEIASLPPLLGNVSSIKTLLLDGNLFRVPRRQILEQGTPAVLEYLRGRIPVSQQ
ncbi:Ras suppressor protein 1 [Actinomortierella wolfii]|nr:Ras suppressor protein 1 [Actinomortierella wolfii]